MVPTVQSNALYQVGPDTVVHFAYQLFDEELELVEGFEVSVFSFLFGYGQLVAALEAALRGMRPGDERRVKLTPDDAFGHRDPTAVIEVERDEFPPGVQLGDEFQAEDGNGNEVTLVVLDCDDEQVVLDANHPLAGQTVTLAVRIEAVRPALTEEIAEAAELLESGQAGAPRLLPAAGLLRRPSTADSRATDDPNEAGGTD
jgi:FKBP-type peptidyl-prolyl cis-trans isomerase SlyD